MTPIDDVKLANQKFNILDHMPLGICVLRKDLTVLFWNQILEDWTSIPKNDLEGKLITEPYPRLKEDKYSSRFNQVFKTRSPIILSYQLHKYIIPAPLPGGRMRFQQTTLSPVDSPDGKDTWLLMSIEDVTDNVARIEQHKDAHNLALKEIEERTIAEEKLFQKTAELQAVFLAFPDLYFRLDSDGQILDHHTGEVSQMYILTDAFKGKNIRDIFPPNVGQQFNYSLKEVLRKDAPVGIEYSLPMKNGERNYEARILPLHKRQLIVIIRDITERKIAEDALRNSEERYRILVESATDAIFTLNRTGLFLSANQATSRAIGKTPQEMIDKNIYDLFEHDTAFLLMESLESVFLTGNPAYTLKLPIQTTSRKRWYNIIISPIRNKNREIIYTLGIARNVTEHKKAEEALQESEERFRILVEHAWDAFYLHDLTGKIIDINQHAYESLGFTKDELLDMNFQDIEMNSEPLNIKDMWQCLIPGSVQNIEGIQKRKDGTTFPVEIRFGLIEHNENNFVLALVREKNIEPTSPA